MKESIAIKDILKGDTIRKEAKVSKVHPIRAVEYIAEFDCDSLNGTDGEFFRIAHPAIAMPEVDGYYFDKDGGLWQLLGGYWWTATADQEEDPLPTFKPIHSKVAASFAPLVKAVPATDEDEVFDAGQQDMASDVRDYLDAFPKWTSQSVTEVYVELREKLSDLWIYVDSFVNTNNRTPKENA